MALEHLTDLTALDDNGGLTELGLLMAEMPVHPMMAKMLLASEKYKCSEEIVTIAAMLLVNNAVFYRPKDIQMAIDADRARRNFYSPAGDHFTLLNVYKQWVETDFSTQWCLQNFVRERSMCRARKVREELVYLVELVEIEMVSNGGDPIAIGKAITDGYFYNTARLSRSGEYKTVKHNQTVKIHPDSCMIEDLPRWVIFHEIVMNTEALMREIIPIENKWLLEVAPHYYRYTLLDLEDRASINRKHLHKHHQH